MTELCPNSLCCLRTLACLDNIPCCLCGCGGTECTYGKSDTEYCVCWFYHLKYNIDKVHRRIKELEERAEHKEDDRASRRAVLAAGPGLSGGGAVSDSPMLALDLESLPNQISSLQPSDYLAVHSGANGITVKISLTALLGWIGYELSYMDMTQELHDLQQQVAALRASAGTLVASAPRLQRMRAENRTGEQAHESDRLVSDPGCTSVSGYASEGDDHLV